MHREMVETYRYLRDHAKPISERDAADLAKIRAPQPPSRAHLKRLRRHANGVVFVEKARPYPEESESSKLLGRQLEAFKRIMSKVPAQPRTILPDPDAYVKDKPFVHIEPVRNQELYPERKPLGPTDLERKILARKAMIARARMVYNSAEPNMIDVLEVFGSFECYKREIEK